MVHQYKSRGDQTNANQKRDVRPLNLVLGSRAKRDQPYMLAMSNLLPLVPVKWLNNLTNASCVAISGSQNSHGLLVSGIALEQLAGNAFRVLRTLAVQGESRSLKSVIAYAGRLYEFATH